jgi:hypothetical protein
MTNDFSSLSSGGENGARKLVRNGDVLGQERVWLHDLDSHTHDQHNVGPLPVLLLKALVASRPLP